MYHFQGNKMERSAEEIFPIKFIIKLSSKGWINSDIFLDWFQFFIDSIPDTRPRVLLMDSHSSQLGPEVSQLAKENQNFLFTFPAHTSHLLQPLAVSVYRPLEAAWAKSMNSYMRNHPDDKPNRFNFHSIFTLPIFQASLMKISQLDIERLGYYHSTRGNTKRSNCSINLD